MFLWVLSLLCSDWLVGHLPIEDSNSKDTDK
jgi:hypothetical protein